MSASGTKRTLISKLGMSALGGKADDIGSHLIRFIALDCYRQCVVDHPHGILLHTRKHMGIGV
jgi:hypothetical protein